LGWVTCSMWHVLWHVRCKNGPGGLFASGLEVSGGEVGVALRYLQGAMPKDLSKGVEINPGHDGVTGKRVTQGVERDALQVSPDHGFPKPFLQVGKATGKPSPKGDRAALKHGNHFLRQWNNPTVTILRVRQNRYLALQVNLLTVKTQHFRCPHTRP